jgi:hypothetical protein
MMLGPVAAALLGLPGSARPITTLEAEMKGWLNAGARTMAAFDDRLDRDIPDEG